MSGFSLSVALIVPLGLAVGWYARLGNLLNQFIEICRNTAPLKDRTKAVQMMLVNHSRRPTARYHRSCADAGRQCSRSRHVGRCWARFWLAALAWTNSSGSATCVRLWAAVQISWISQVGSFKQLSKAIDASDPEDIGWLYHQHWAPCAKCVDEDDTGAQYRCVVSGIDSPLSP
ncbi:MULTISPECIES: hypothetical protein [unclassified Bradyrhizobium]|uniref:hypothetical protein n=1 Tax=unclassified Bradyrhizobium TaxID=2631580 RepID=UPI0024786F7B|nr:MULTISPECIES: hypothetical protein [unclassified Bradyrhizobium]WGR73293.1 hypothetical protein MTX24_10920 [Bradyrhizobium sp. ISRA426]WGR78130.1 hypothetical protein MTX21_35890 [Bradyrhizobium sp. ISRA430]WGR88531.1 hypothetical protein MTX25_10930 [Bradyrhizobium sp. ISRA432]